MNNVDREMASLLSLSKENVALLKDFEDCCLKSV
jgi:hypothetical protein